MRVLFGSLKNSMSAMREIRVDLRKPVLVPPHSR